jgi:hypothetical protein
VLAALVAGVAVLGLGAGAGSATERTSDDLHDARYCEILELQGAIPDARVKVWNTIGLNDCPAAWWDSLDAGAVADELGAELVVLNGPRHFLMDAASGKVGKSRLIAGKRLRKVATIPIESAADLVQTPYAERIVERRNSWTWNAGRRVYKLIAPDGARYVMQAYSQIRDPELAIGDLRSLADRLELPLGWRYRTHRLRRDLVLRAGGAATIVQDELLNTYQRLPRRPDGGPGERHAVALTGAIRTVGSPAPGTLRDVGTVSGEPFGDGTVTLEVTLASGTASGPFRIRAEGGSVFGETELTYEIAGGEISFRGTARFVGGTGEYRGIRAENLTATDVNTLDGQSGRLTLDGFARY